MRNSCILLILFSSNDQKRLHRHKTRRFHIAMKSSIFCLVFLTPFLDPYPKFQPPFTGLKSYAYSGLSMHDSSNTTKTLPFNPPLSRKTGLKIKRAKPCSRFACKSLSFFDSHIYHRDITYKSLLIQSQSTPNELLSKPKKVVRFSQQLLYFPLYASLREA